MADGSIIRRSQGSPDLKQEWTHESTSGNPAPMPLSGWEATLSWNDPNTFVEIYRVYSPQVGRYLSKCNGRLAIDDLVHEVFIRLWVRRPPITGAPNLQSYILEIAREVYYEERSRRKREKRFFVAGNLDTIASHQESSEPPDMDQELAKAIRRVNRSLSAKQREALQIACLRGISTQEAARRVGCSPAAFRNRLSQARNRCMEVLGRWLS